MTALLAQPFVDVGIVSNDRHAALSFWNEFLGFPVEGEVQFPGLTIIRLKVGETTLRICVPDQKVEALAETGAFHSQTGLRYITLAVQNLDELAAEAAERGYPVPHLPREIRPGYRVAQIQDGCGVTVELTETAKS